MDFTEVDKNELWNLCNQCNPCLSGQASVIQTEVFVAIRVITSIQSTTTNDKKYIPEELGNLYLVLMRGGLGL
ncbi:MAG: hypothetical protein IPM04_01685 [Saprospiraceae bacterium]|nr:hypothetical protein [Candidatus Brachybacter algidus]MBK8746594.1 hypothetical protein [Candidatus Brachybacter algidus]